MYTFTLIARRLWPLCALLACLQLLPAAVAASDTEARAVREYILWYRNFDNPAIRNLVELALRKTPEYGAYRIVRSEELSQGRALRELGNTKSRILDIANVATSEERELFLNAIPVPVDGGLLGFRVCLVLPENLNRFDGITSLDDMRKRGISIGQGAHWPDTPILEANGLSVITHTRYEILFGMLRNRRFDCFARGVSEVMFDLQHNKADDLAIEPNILLAYAMPSYLFVSPSDHETAQRLELGLERAILDGSFAVYLRNWFGNAVASLGLDRRSVITLENPYLSEDSGYVGRHTLENLKRRVELLTVEQ